MDYRTQLQTDSDIYVRPNISNSIKALLTLYVLIRREGHKAALEAIGYRIALGDQKLANIAVEEGINAPALGHRDNLQRNVGILGCQDATKIRKY